MGAVYRARQVDLDRTGTEAARKAPSFLDMNPMPEGPGKGN